jgi:hypothetical protein
MLKKHPHKAIIQWFPEPTVDPVTGIKTDGQPVKYPVECSFQPAGNSEYNSVNGNTTLKYGYKVFMDPVDFAIPKNAEIIWNDVKMDISRVDPYQKGVVLWL